MLQSSCEDKGYYGEAIDELRLYVIEEEALRKVPILFLCSLIHGRVSCLNSDWRARSEQRPLTTPSQPAVKSLAEIESDMGLLIEEHNGSRGDRQIVGAALDRLSRTVR